MLKRIIHWRTYRQIDRAMKNYSWNLATRLAKRIGDRGLQQACALARITQLMNPDAPQNTD